MTLLFDVAIIAGGLALGRWLVRRVRARRDPGSPPTPETAAPGTARHDLPAAFPCQLGDVVVRVAERDEAWLAGALVFAEDRPVAALFVAPEAGGDRAVFVREAPGAGMIWLTPVVDDALTTKQDPPHAVEHEGVRYERARRLPVRVSRAGSGAPAIGEQAIVAEYAGPAGMRLLVVGGSAQTLAWKGVALTEGDYDVLPGGPDTLEA
ncbi:MAG TPA: hypothetical protein VHS09_02480 [Polyangiaceae bacterium]|nr:hypothetical protein [Polyangiaceae bacterium]